MLAVVTMVLGLTTTPQPPRELHCPIDYLNPRALEEMVRAKTPTDLDRAFQAIVAPDEIARLVYASRMATLAPGRRADMLLIEAIPRTKLDFNLLYTLSYADAGVSSELAEIGGGSWLNQVTEATKRERRGFRQLLMLVTVIGDDNAELSELYPDILVDLRVREPALFRKAYQSLPRQAQAAVDASLASAGSE
jgi:hypothetical protein